MESAAPDRSKRRLGALRQLWPFLKPHRALAIGWLVFLGLSSACTLVLPVAVRHIIDRGFGHASAAAINSTFLGLFGVALVLAFATAARYYCITLLGERALPRCAVRCMRTWSVSTSRSSSAVASAN
jgi:ATP-binding cassette subfamily B protein